MANDLYTFTIFEDKETTIEEERTDETSGEKFTVKKKVAVKSPTRVIIRKPTRRQVEDADMEFSVEMSKCIKKGLMTKAMLSKKYSDNGGLMSEVESEKLVGLYQKVYDLQEEMTRLETDKEKSEEDETRAKTALAELTIARKEIIDTEANYRALFDHTADAKAQSRALLWYVINLCFIQKENEEKERPFFAGKDFEDKLVDFYAKEEENSAFYQELSKKISMFVAFWFFNQATTKEEFEKLEKRIEAGEL